jgi:hypothetical protein
MTPPRTPKQPQNGEVPRTVAERSLVSARESLRRVDARIAARRRRLDQAAKARA